MRSLPFLLVVMLSDGLGNGDVHQKWIEGGNYELCIEDVRDEIWDMVKPADPLRITLSDLLSCKHGGTVASMLIDVRGFWAVAGPGF
ncbi:probable serine/threonine-protein phosphatase 2A regulatory subunit B'' subunit TON2 [Tanacetum coccineum]